MEDFKITDEAKRIINEIGFSKLRSVSLLSDNIINNMANQFDLNKIDEYASMMCVALSFILIKMCRFYYTIVGIVIGIIISILFMYFMG